MSDDAETREPAQDAMAFSGEIVMSLKASVPDTGEARPGPNAAAFAPQADDVFGRIAKRYDLLSDVFSLGIHRLWKRRVAQVLARESWSTLLDGVNPVRTKEDEPAHAATR